jgi:asparagine N-glycosylation enzyme membrane subunit Stt3
MEESRRSRKVLLVVLLAVILVLSIFVSLKLDFSNRDRLFQSLVRDSRDGMEAFQKLSEVTPADAVIFSWWDYGRAIQDYGGRKAVVAYPSRDIFQSIGASQNPVYAVEMAFFGTYDSSEKIHDVARALVLPENESLAIMRKYAATHVMVFEGQDGRGAFDDLQKFQWIARIAGYNASDYVRINMTSPTPRYELTSKAQQVTMIRLLFDERYPPQHFTKLYENSVAKIYRIEYTPSADSTLQSLDELCSVTTRGTPLTACPTKRVGLV